MASSLVSFLAFAASVSMLIGPDRSGVAAGAVPVPVVLPHASRNAPIAAVEKPRALARLMKSRRLWVENTLSNSSGRLMLEKPPFTLRKRTREKQIAQGNYKNFTWASCMQYKHNRYKQYVAIGVFISGRAEVA